MLSVVMKITAIATSIILRNAAIAPIRKMEKPPVIAAVPRPTIVRNGRANPEKAEPTGNRTTCETTVVPTPLTIVAIIVRTSAAAITIPTVRTSAAGITRIIARTTGVTTITSGVVPIIGRLLTITGIIEAAPLILPITEAGVVEAINPIIGATAALPPAPRRVVEAAAPPVEVVGSNRR